MPELYEGENLCRAQLLLHGTLSEAFQESLKLLIFQVSNNLMSESFGKWDDLINLVDRSGMIDLPCPFRISPEADPTISAFMERLFQEALVLTVRGSNSSRKIVSWLLAAGQNPETRCITEFCSLGLQPSPLQVAVSEGDVELTKLLVNSGADINRWTENTPAPIVLAAELEERQQAWEKINILLAAGACATPALTIAIKRGDMELLRLLVQYGADLQRRTWCFWGMVSEETAITLAASCKRDSHCQVTSHYMVQYFLESIKSISQRLRFYELSPIRPDDFIASAKSGNDDVIRLLHREGGHVNLCNRFGISPLHAAAYEGHLRTCELLIQLGAEVQGPQPAYPSPLHLSAYRNNLDIVRALVARGALLDATANISDHRTRRITIIRFYCSFRPKQPKQLFCSPLTVALLECSTDCAEYLIDAGAEVKIGVLLAGVQNKDSRIVDSALRVGSNPNEVDKEGRSSLQIALDVGHVGIAMRLLDEGALIRGTELPLAIKLGEWRLVEQLLILGADPRQKTPCGETMLEIAIFSGNQQTIQGILCTGAAAYDSGALCAAVLSASLDGGSSLVTGLLNIRPWGAEADQFEGTCITMAVLMKDLTLLALLLEHLPQSNSSFLPIPNYQIRFGYANICNWDAWVNLCSPRSAYEQYYGHRPFWRTKDCPMGSPLVAALHNGDEQITSLLLGHGFGFDRLSLQYAVAINSASKVRVITTNAALFPNPTLDALPPPLQCAIFNGNAEIVGLLLDSGEDVNAYHWRMTALHIAVRKRDLQLVHILLSAGANVNAEPHTTALQEAVGLGDMELVNVLLKAGANVNARTNTGGSVTALLCAIERGHRELADNLLKAGANVNAAPSSHLGRTALQYAVESGHLELISILLNAGADIHAEPSSSGGATALQLAAIKGKLGIAKHLFELGADVNAHGADEFGRTALEGAAEHGRIDMIRLLISFGVETTGSGQFQYLRAVKLAEFECYAVAATLLRSHRDWTETDFEIYKGIKVDEDLDFDSNSSDEGSEVEEDF
jgi:ankyrin repeat protein